MIKVVLTKEKERYTEIEKKLMSQEEEKVSLKSFLYLSEEDFIKIAKKIKIYKNKISNNLKEEDIFKNSLSKQREIYAKYLYLYATFILLKFAETKFPFNNDFFTLLSKINNTSQPTDEEGKKHIEEVYLLAVKIYFFLNKKYGKVKDYDEYINETVIKYIQKK